MGFLQGESKLPSRGELGKALSNEYRPLQATRDKYYVQPATDGEIAKLLDDQLDLINDPESCYVTEDDPPKAGQETTNEPNIFEEDAEERDHDHNPSCEGLEHSKNRSDCRF